ncbi:Hypothetical protein R9X50_00071700 [Acrodontium crateriforme]|uniref:Spindle pole body-associated protein cut12 domain-containing protein n=1 Tax=Acrodontium crateriforme TaxID=150365 RepID=A0AAQ3LZA9_9PEZI|nr:Hypothetical protein R9X50_00071700 [Acrodontium crateriforme]
MLHWLAGKPLPEGMQEPDATDLVEPPETPAPVFAVRAFKHAIFGTPQTQQQPKPRRNSNTDHSRPRNHDAKLQRPGMTRPRSASDAQGLWNAIEEAAVPDQAASPTKGILMTPGTAGAKRKTVSFGDDIMENQERQGVNFGGNDDKNHGVDKSRGRSKLTEALEQARDESAKRISKYAKYNKTSDEELDVPKEFSEPKSESGIYWKAQYDIYRENTQREVKKLLTKQKVAKSFAKDKDEECAELTKQLEKERSKVQKLERRNADLENRLKELELQAEQTKDELPSVTKTTSSTEHAVSHQQRASERRAERAVNNRIGSLSGTRLSAAAPRKSNVQSNSTQEPDSQAMPKDTSSKLRPDKNSQEARTRPADDIWALSFNSSSPALLKKSSQQQLNSGKTSVGGTDGAALKSISPNTLQVETSNGREASVVTSPSATQFKSPLIRKIGIPPPTKDNQNQNSPLSSPILPFPSPEPAPQNPLRERKSNARQASVADASDDISIPVPASSPFQSSPILSMSAPTATSAHPQPSTTHAPQVTNTKENVAPISRARSSQENVKPLTTVNAFNGAPPVKRVTSITDKKGREISNERLEAAKARLAARGKLVT